MSRHIDAIQRMNRIDIAETVALATANAQCTERHTALKTARCCGTV